MQQTILHAKPWSDYDKRKSLSAHDQLVFCPDDPWEINYLIEKIKSYYPSYTDIAISLAIRQAVKSSFSPRNRIDFVNTVMRRLMEKKALMLG